MRKNKLPPKFSATRYHKSESKLPTVLPFLLKNIESFAVFLKKLLKMVLTESKTENWFMQDCMYNDFAISRLTITEAEIKNWRYFSTNSMIIIAKWWTSAHGREGQPSMQGQGDARFLKIKKESTRSSS